MTRTFALSLALAVPAAAADDLDALLKTFAEELIAVTPGQDKFPKSFMMGGSRDTEKPVREVTFAHPFRMAKYEVPQNLYEAVVGSNPSRWKGKRNSVEVTSHTEVTEFCKKLTDLLRARKLIKDDETVRLPTEAEWEYCCRAGTTTEWSFGDDEKELGVYGWFTGNAAGNDPPVGAKKPNAWGFYDMHGYLWEWCADSWQADFKDAPVDGSARTIAGAKEFVMRSGSWKDKAPETRSASRRGAPADTRGDHIGFRCVVSGK